MHAASTLRSLSEEKRGLTERAPPLRLQGVGLLAGVGVLVATAGNNTYRALERPDDTDFFHRSSFPGGAAEIILSHCNQGCGLMMGSGVLVDAHVEGRDTYLNEAWRPWATHHDGDVAGPQVSTQPGPEGAADLGQVDCSYFLDGPAGGGTAYPGQGRLAPRGRGRDDA